MPLPSDKVIGARLPSTLRQLGALTCGPWNYAAPHIIRNDTDVRIIEPEYTPVPHRPPPPTPADSPVRPHRRRTHPAARKAKPVRMQIFVVLHFVIRSVWPGAARISRCKRALQCDYAVALKRSSRDSSDYSARCCHYLTKFYRDDWLTKNTNLHLWEKNIQRCRWCPVKFLRSWDYFKSMLPLFIQLYGLMTYNSPIHIFKWDIFVNTEYIY